MDGIVKNFMLFNKISLLLSYDILNEFFDINRKDFWNPKTRKNY